MKYQGKSFSVGSTAALRANWDAVFGPPKSLEEFAAAAKLRFVCKDTFESRRCRLHTRHKGAHTDYDVEWVNGKLL